MWNVFFSLVKHVKTQWNERKKKSQKKTHMNEFEVKKGQTIFNENTFCLSSNKKESWCDQSNSLRSKKIKSIQGNVLLRRCRWEMSMREKKNDKQCDELRKECSKAFPSLSTETVLLLLLIDVSDKDGKKIDQ